jgi:hypothetical protein
MCTHTLAMILAKDLLRFLIRFREQGVATPFAGPSKESKTGLASYCSTGV